jgi:hypothetical protein
VFRQTLLLRLLRTLPLPITHHRVKGIFLLSLSRLREDLSLVFSIVELIRSIRGKELERRAHGFELDGRGRVWA